LKQVFAMSQEDTTRTRLLDAAGAVFAEHGFEKATVREICTRAEVNLASVNYHFGDKRRLYVETIRFAHQQAAAQTPVGDWPPDTPAAEKLRGIVFSLLKRMLSVKQFPWQSQLMMREFTQPTGVCQELADEYVKPLSELMLNVIGELAPPEIPLYRRKQLMFSLVGQCTFYKFHGPIVGLLVDDAEAREHFSPSRLADHITQVMLAALGVARDISPSDASAAGATGLVI
jgi:AcrR family transcriptional regulator